MFENWQKRRKELTNRTN